MNFQVITKLLSYDYKSAFEKIGFTVAGILIALWINRCDETLKRHDLERKSLLEVRNALRIDLKDIDETLATANRDDKALKKAVDFLEGKPCNVDSLPEYFYYSFFYTFQLANTAAYETLKARGLDIVRTDSLRTAIATLYDVVYEHHAKMEKIRNKTYEDYVNPTRIKYFLTFPKGVEALRHLDFNTIRKDQSVLTALRVQRELFSRNMEDFRTLDKEARRLIAMIEKTTSD